MRGQYLHRLPLHCFQVHLFIIHAKCSILHHPFSCPDACMTMACSFSSGAPAYSIDVLEQSAMVKCWVSLAQTTRLEAHLLAYVFPMADALVRLSPDVLNPGRADFAFLTLACTSRTQKFPFECDS